MSPSAPLAQRIYALLLRAYPAEFRSSYAREMTLVFRSQWREASEPGLRFWTTVLWDVARSAPALRAESLRARWREHNQRVEGTMKPMAMLAVLVGVIQIVNAMVEASAGRSGLGDGYSLVGVALGMAAAALLIAAGGVLLRRGWSSAATARIAAIACVALVVVIRFVQPWMSIFGMLLGIGFPLALLLFLFITKRREPSAMTA